MPALSVKAVRPHTTAAQCEILDLERHLTAIRAPSPSLDLSGAIGRSTARLEGLAPLRATRTVWRSRRHDGSRPSHPVERRPTVGVGCPRGLVDATWRLLTRTRALGPHARSGDRHVVDVRAAARDPPIVQDHHARVEVLRQRPRYLLFAARPPRPRRLVNWVLNESQHQPTHPRMLLADATLTIRAATLVLAPRAHAGAARLEVRLLERGHPRRVSTRTPRRPTHNGRMDRGRLNPIARSSMHRLPGTRCRAPGLIKGAPIASSRGCRNIGLSGRFKTLLVWLEIS